MTIVPLGTTFFHGSLISHELRELLEHQPPGDQTLLFYNRRGSGRAWICEDCGYFPLCPNCDIALAYHTYPRIQLVCHHCSYRSDTLELCPTCGNTTFHEVGIGIQKIAQDFGKIFPLKTLFRVDSDASIDKKSLTSDVREKDLILATHAGLSLLHLEGIQNLVFLLFESDLTLPDYRMEEDLYHALDYAKKSGKSIMIQTYMPEHPLLRTLTEGNYRDFLQMMSIERKKFHYPPYTDFVTIHLHDDSKDRLENIFHKLVNKIRALKTENIFFAYDREITDRSRGEWQVKIILKGNNLPILLDELEVELVRNRSITLEWN